MMNTKPICAALLAASLLPSSAASDLVNALNTYSGTSQDGDNGAAQPAFLTDPPASGLEVSFLAAGFTAVDAWETVYFNNTTPPVGEFPGVKLGGNRGNPGQDGGNDGRNYMRTVETDYNTKDFTAYVTVRRSIPSVGTNRRSVFFGLGTGLRSGGNAPDQGSANASVFLELQNGFGNASRRLLGDPLPNQNLNQFTEFNWEPLTTVSDDAMRIRMVYDSVASTVSYAIDYGYDGVTFVADQLIDEENNSAPTTPVAKQAAEWADGDRASIYFGGDRSVVFTDLVIDVTDPPIPPTPTSLQLVSVGNQIVNLQWSSIAIPGTTFSVYRSTTDGVFADPALATGLTDKLYTDNAVVNGTTYFYRVTQTNTVATTPESAVSNQISATPVAGAVAPGGVAARNAGNNVVVIDWTDLVAPFDSYKIYRSAAAEGPFVEVAQIFPDLDGSDDSLYIDESVTSGNTYFYRVTSVLGGNESVPSAVTAAVIPGTIEVFFDVNGGEPPLSNAGRGVLGAGTGTSWNADAGGTSLVSTKLNDSLGLATAVALSGTANGTFAAASGTNVGGVKTVPGSQTLVDSYNLMVDYRFTFPKREYVFSGLAPNRKYDLYLFGYGDNPGANTAFNVGGVVKQTKDPLGLAAMTEGRHYVTFTFVSDPEGSFMFEMGLPGQLGLVDADGSDGVSVLNGYQLVENSTAVLQPLNLSANALTNLIDLSWEGVDGATSYKIYRSSTPASDYSLLASPVGVGTTYSDSTAVPGTTYYYVVKALIDTVESFYSGEASAMIESLSTDTDLDGLSDADEALIGTNPNDPSDFFVAQSSTVTPSGGNYNVSIAINGAPGTYVIERSTTLQMGSWTEIASSSTAFTWNTGTVLEHPLTLSAPALAPAPGGKEFFRAKGITPIPAN